MIDPSQQGAPPAMMGGPQMSGQQMGAPPPETLDGVDPVAQMIGMSLDPGTLAQIAMGAIGQLLEADQAAFSEGQRQSVMQAIPAIQAIIAQLQQAPPETLDGPETMAVAPEEEDPAAMGMMA